VNGLDRIELSLLCLNECVNEHVKYSVELESKSVVDMKDKE
jgi:hypothetical protein